MAKLDMFTKGRKPYIYEIQNHPTDLDEWAKNLNKRILQEFQYLKSIEDNKTYLLHLKFEELKEYVSKIDKRKIKSVFEKTQNFDDMMEFMKREKNDIKFIDADKEPYKTDWLILRMFVSTLYWSQNPGRNLRYLLQINGKYCGMFSLASDVIAMSERDNYIGWDKSVKIEGPKRLNNTCIASSIVPTQPIGFMATGGKLMCLLLHSHFFQKAWKEKYGDVLVGMTTTSLYGINSQYNGMPKYWKTLGVTKGSIILSPLEKTYSEIREYCLKRAKIDKDFGKKYDDALNAKNDTCATGPKQNVLNLYYKESGFKALMSQHKIQTRDLQSGFEKGIYFARYYDNTIDFLQGKINEDQLIPRKDFDFDIHDLNSIVDYWKRKYANNRLLKTMEMDSKYQEQFFHDKIFEIDDIKEFVRVYGKKEA
ncbi:MAG TPA: DUF4338 domain-containing protein [Candidatus Dojkabacteria bacterium]|nr:DUF4338 domain-containing protein [Candidatus Dojkabacteria bacterium]